MNKNNVICFFLALGVLFLGYTLGNSSQEAQMESQNNEISQKTISNVNGAKVDENKLQKGAIESEKIIPKEGVVIKVLLDEALPKDKVKDLISGLKLVPELKKAEFKELYFGKDPEVKELMGKHNSKLLPMIIFNTNDFGEGSFFSQGLQKSNNEFILPIGSDYNPETKEFIKQNVSQQNNTGSGNNTEVTPSDQKIQNVNIVPNE